MTPEEEKKKRELFESMSPRSQKRIMKKGYDKWDPFLAPKEPPFFNEEERKKVQQARERLQQFLQQKHRENPEEALPEAYVQGARDICFGLQKEDERFQGMYDFCRWLIDLKEAGSEEE